MNALCLSQAIAMTAAASLLCSKHAKTHNDYQTVSHIQFSSERPAVS